MQMTATQWWEHCGCKGRMYSLNYTGVYQLLWRACDLFVKYLV